MHQKIDKIEIIIQLLSLLVFVICGFVKDFLPHSYFILQIYHAKSFKMRHDMSLYLNFPVRYSWNALKTQNYYLDLIDFQYAPLTYTLCIYYTYVKFKEFQITEEGAVKIGTLEISVST